MEGAGLSGEQVTQIRPFSPDLTHCSDGFQLALSDSPRSHRWLGDSWVPTLVSSLNEHLKLMLTQDNHLQHWPLQSQDWTKSFKINFSACHKLGPVCDTGTRMQSMQMRSLALKWSRACALLQMLQLKHCRSLVSVWLSTLASVHQSRCQTDNLTSPLTAASPGHKTAHKSAWPLVPSTAASLQLTGEKRACTW